MLNFSRNGARNVKLECAFPDLQLFVDSVKNYQNESVGEKVFNDQEFYRLKKLVLKAKRQLEDDEYV